jgi:bifunctional non-homologous end joining protein LigD
MLATVGGHRLDDPAFVYEPKYDGIRAIVRVDPASGAHPVTIWSRLGNEKTSQFPEVVRALAPFAKKGRKPLVIDGEIVALDEAGNPVGFQNLQGRIHLTAAAPSGEPVAFIAFDLLRDGSDDLCAEPLVERRRRLERVLEGKTGRVLRISEQSAGKGQPLFDRAMSGGAEGLIAKRADSVYHAGRRSPDWIKVKIAATQEFVVGGWTEPRGARSYFGALLLGVYEGGDLVYAGHTGTGFDERELSRVWKLLKPLERPTSPFRVRPKTNERPHWVEPKLVAQVKFTEWTADDKLRHPTYLGLRDDVQPESVRREPQSAVQREAVTSRRGKSRVRPSSRTDVATGPLLEQLQDLEDRGADGAIALPDGDRLEVSNLKKVFWREGHITKGELLRYYVRVSSALLPVVADRPLVMKRLPNGIHGKAFYQQRAPDAVPAGVRVERVEGDTEVPSRLIGGSLKTLLYMTQLASISQDPWFSRAQSPGTADFAAIDLDPMPDVPFSTVLDVARWVRDELQAIGVAGVPKTSGADGLHVYVRLPPGTPYEAGMLFCQIVATIVAAKHPRQATIERTVRARGPRVYVDYLQNVEGKTLACAYSARASDYAGTSTPLTWKEVDEGVDRREFTIRTLPARLEKVGDLWAPLREGRPIDLRAVERYLVR